MRGLIQKTITTLAALSVIAASGACAEDRLHLPDPAMELPQEIQASAEPASQRVIPEGYYPTTHVILPERMQRPGNEMESRSWFANFASGDNDVFAPAPTETLPRTRETWFTNFASGGNAIFDVWTEGEATVFEKKTGAWFDNFAAGDDDIFEHSENKNSVRREAHIDEEGYLIFSGISGAHSAHASIALPDRYYDAAASENNDAVRIPKTFSFNSDDSPIILAEVTSPGSNGPVTASRREYGIRAFWPGRNQTEILEREPYAPKPNQDTPAMVPPAGGAIRRAEVKLPTSSQGLGMASGYFPGR